MFKKSTNKPSQFSIFALIPHLMSDPLKEKYYNTNMTPVFKDVECGVNSLS